LAVPTLVLHGTEDKVATPAGARALRSIPASDFVGVEGSAHLPYVGRPDVCGPALAGFLEKVDAAEEATP